MQTNFNDGLIALVALGGEALLVATFAECLPVSLVEILTCKLLHAQHTAKTRWMPQLPNCSHYLLTSEIVPLASDET